LNRDLAIENLLARKLRDGTISFRGSSEVNEGIANGTVGARVDRNGGALNRILLEEILEFPLSGRVGEVPNVQPTTFGSTSDHVCILGSVAIASVCSAGRVRDAGRGHVIGEIVNGSRHVEG